MKAKSAVKANNAGLPADRRETKMTLVGMAPHADVSLAKSGYEKAWSSQTGSVKGAGTIGTSKANGGACSKVGTKHGK